LIGAQSLRRPKAKAGNAGEQRTGDARHQDVQGQIMMPIAA
jgi:hypothetical protein